MASADEPGFDSNRDSNRGHLSAVSGGRQRSSRSRKRGNSEGSLYQRQDGRWVASATSADGRRVSRYARTRVEASAKLTALLKAFQEGTPVPPERQTVGEFLAFWLSDTVRGSVRPATFTSYEAIVRRHLIPAVGRHSLARLTPQHVQALMRQKSADGLSPRRVAYIRGVLRQALGVALQWGLVTRNVATLARPPRIERTEVSPLTADQAAALMTHVRDDRLAALYTLALAVGLRQGELLALRWADIDLDRAELRVHQALQRIDGRLQFVEPKTRRSRRTVGVPAFAVSALREHRARQLQERLAAGTEWTDLGLVFTTAQGRPLDARNVTRMFGRHVERAGLPHQRFHDLRHACASLLLAQGVSARVIMEVLGHSQISLTLNTYSHVMPHLQAEAADRMDALFGPASHRSVGPT